eukprot:jgi/Undpi1/10461/HiC_scaffold_29.g12911.m1
MEMFMFSTPTAQSRERLAVLVWRGTICGVGLAAYTDRSRDAASSGTTMLPPQRPPAAEGVAKKRLLRGRTPIVVGEARWGLGDLFPLPQQVPTRSALGARVCDTKDKEDVEEAAAADVVVAAETPPTASALRRLSSGSQALGLGSNMSGDSVIKDVLVIVAMEAEAAPLIERLGLVEDPGKFPSAAPSKCYGGKYKGATVNVVTNGKCERFGVDQIGTVAAGLSTWLSLEALKPDLVVNAGTAGGFKAHDTAIGDVFVSTVVNNHDRRIPIPGFKELGIGDHKAHLTPAMVKELGFKQGAVTTGNSFDHTPTDDAIMAEHDARVKDMEAAAVAWACELHKTPFFCLKVVTDLVDGGGVGEEEFMQNLKAASDSLQEAMPRVLDFVLTRPLSEL